MTHSPSPTSRLARTHASRTGSTPSPASREVFTFHRPETLAAWLDERQRAPERATLRSRLQQMPPLEMGLLWPPKDVAITNLERSLAENRPRALIQMATGSGKTFTRCVRRYRLIKFAGAQADPVPGGPGEPRPPDAEGVPGFHDAGRRPQVHRALQRPAPVVERRSTPSPGDDHDDPAPVLDHEGRAGARPGDRRALALTSCPDLTPLPVVYNPTLPIETFDVIIVDECHRSIYGVWRQVLDYFDAFIIGLTATPNKQTFGFFNKNLVMEYTHEQAVADDVNVGFDVYRIQTEITEHGSARSRPGVVRGSPRPRRPARCAGRKLDEDFDVRRQPARPAVVAKDQIRTVIRTFKERLFTEIFPGRTEVPKTLIFAKDDSHAEDIVEIVREEFGKGNDFAEDHLQARPARSQRTCSPSSATPTTPASPSPWT